MEGIKITLDIPSDELKAKMEEIIGHGNSYPYKGKSTNLDDYIDWATRDFMQENLKRILTEDGDMQNFLREGLKKWLSSDKVVDSICEVLFSYQVHSD